MKLLDFIVCDDIRQEIGNKPSLMGVYANNIILPPSPEGDTKWPFALRLGFFVRFLRESSDTQPDVFRVEFIRDGGVFSKVEGLVTAAPESDINLSIALVNSAFQIMGVGPISFRIVFSKEGKGIGQFEPDYSLNVEVAKESQKTGSQRKK